MYGLASLPTNGTFVGRVFRPENSGPSIVLVRDGDILDITSAEVPTMRDLLGKDDPAAFVRTQEGATVASLDEIMERSVEAAGTSHAFLLAPCDLQAVKACGVTFARSMIERVIEEKAVGDPAMARTIRERVTAVIGDSLRNLCPGSAEAAKVKRR